MLELFHMFPA